MLRKAKILTWLVGLTLLCATCLTLAFAGMMQTYATGEVSVETVTVTGYDVNMSTAGTRYSGLYEIKVDLGVPLGGDSYGIMDGDEAQRAVQDYILINGVSVREINSTVDDSDYLYLTFPGSESDIYAVPVLLHVPDGATYIKLMLHCDYISTLYGKMEITVKNGLSYNTGTDIVKYIGEDVTYKFLAGSWYKSDEVPTEFTEIKSTDGLIFEGIISSGNYRFAVPIDQSIGGTVGEFHVTEPGKTWNYMQNYLIINGQSVSSINTAVDDSTYNYSSGNWVLNWASSDPASGYCQPVFVQVSGFNLFFNLPKEYYESSFGKAIILEILPGFGWKDADGNIYMNSERIVVARILDTNGNSAVATATQPDGIDVTEGYFGIQEADNGTEVYFDLYFSHNIMLETHYTGGLNFDYVGDIWSKYVFIDGLSISSPAFAGKVRVELASGTTFDNMKMIRIYVDKSLSLTGTSILLKEKTPFSSGELLSSDFEMNFNAAAGEDTAGNAVIGWTNGTTELSVGEVYGVCVKSGNSVEPMKAKYAITYVTGGGVNDADNPEYYVEGEIVTFAPASGKEGYDFVNWTCKGEVIAATTAETVGALELTAVWEMTEGAKFASLSLNGDIGINIYVYIKNISEVDELTANDGKIKGVKTVRDGTEYFVFTVGVAAKDYETPVSISVDGYDITSTYSVSDYIAAFTEEDEGYELVSALAKYCEAAKVLFDDELASEAQDDESLALSVEDEAALGGFAAVVSGTDDTVSLVGATLVLESETSIYIYFMAEGDISTATFKVDGAEVIPEAVAGYDGYYVIKIENISAKDLDKEFTVNIGGIIVQYSALSYVNKTLSGTYEAAIGNVCKALYAYNKQANIFFTK